MQGRLLSAVVLHLYDSENNADGGGFARWDMLEWP
jgi:hypothetical protein